MNKTALKIAKLPNESFETFALRVYRLRVTLNIDSDIPIGVSVSRKRGIARFYYKEKPK